MKENVDFWIVSTPTCGNSVFFAIVGVEQGMTQASIAAQADSSPGTMQLVR